MSVSKENPVCATGSSCFKEAVCVDTRRIYDSASDKDCLDDLQVYFTDLDQKIIDTATSVRIKECEILHVFLDVESIAFNKGFYSVDITFFFEVKLSVYTAPLIPPITIRGLSIFSKKVILYGSEGNVRTFSSDQVCVHQKPNNNMPLATVQCVDPVCLAVKLVEKCDCSCDPCCEIPQCVCGCFEGDFGHCCETKKHICVTLGLFTIVQLERHVQIMVPAYDFCVPDKESVTSSCDDPCELFKKIKFPIDAFFPPKMEDLTDN
ncbi:MAG: hypothetical protein RR064_00690 [Oscillospiraceae bacterium]